MIYPPVSAPDYSRLLCFTSRKQMSVKISSPHDGSFYKQIPLQSKQVTSDAILLAKQAQKDWKLQPLEDRKDVIEKFIALIELEKEEIAEELSRLIGRPKSQNFNEVKGFAFRARAMLEMAESSLADYLIEDSVDFQRFMTREPLGVIFIISAWNFPYLVSVNSVVAALLAGNSVLLKHAPQTFLVAERFERALSEVGLPKGVFQALYIDHETSELVIKSPLISYIHFTGSVKGGMQVNQIASSSLASVGLELGGKDPAYVCSDADPISTAENLVDGAFYNSGQSCCAVERIYVHTNVYAAFVQHAVKTAKAYVLGDPLNPETNLGPVININAANAIKAQIKDAVEKGAKLEIEESYFSAAKEGSAFVGPQILTNVNHSMLVMKEETFGPIVGIMKVDSDEEAIKLMNDSDFGLTASVWTNNRKTGLEIGKRIETGTFFINRCDYLDPYLAWAGIKSSGRGCSLSKYGFDQLTRPKSYHLKK